MLNLKTLLKELRNSGMWIESPVSLKEESQIGKVIIAKNLLKIEVCQVHQDLAEWVGSGSSAFLNPSSDS